MIYKLNGREVSREEFLGDKEESERRWQEMVNSGQPPAAMTDREFLHGRGGAYDQFRGSPTGNYYAALAKKAGVDTTGKIYLSGLAAYPGDPRAWVSGRGDVQRVCEERGWGCEGSVNVKPRDSAELTGGGLASDIVDELVERQMESDPGRHPEDVREEVIQKHAPHYAKREIEGNDDV